MSNFYTPSQGLVPKTRQQLLIDAHAYLSANGIYVDDYHLFLGSNWHLFLSNSVFPMLEAQQASFYEAQAELFSFWNNHYMSVQGGLGASYEGVRTIFAPHCTGLNIVAYDGDPSLGSAGNMSLYFDNLTDDAELRQQLFRMAMPIGIFTPQGDQQIEVQFSGNNAKTFTFFNLLPDDYTPLQIKIEVRYKAGTVAYPDDLIKESVQQEFDRVNVIGRNFYSRSYFNHALLPNVGSMTIHSSLDGSIWNGGNQPAKFGQKFIIDSAEVVSYGG